MNKLDLMKINNKLAVVVLFWNDSKKTISCLNSLLSQRKQKLKIILVDNNSDKEFSKKIFNWLKKKKIKLINVSGTKLLKVQYKSNKICFYIKNKINYGCGLGHNSGYQFCLKNNFKYIARIDNDMIAPKYLMFNLVKRLESNKDIIALSPKVMYQDNPNRIWFGGAKIGINLKLQKQCGNYICEKKDSIKFRGLVHTDAIAGCASIMKSENLKKSGLSDPEFFYGEEDIELSYRLKKTSGNLVVDLDQKIYHSVSHTVGANWGKNIYYNYKYRLLLLKKIGTFSDKFFGYNIFFLKFFLSILLCFKNRYSSRLVPVSLAGLHFLQKKYGNYDRKNYNKLDNFFIDYNKQTSILKIFKLLNKYKKLIN
jgi:GT2 family glycosyltransferase